MPFKSEAQRMFMWATDPEMAKEFQSATPKNKKLPERVKHSESEKIASCFGKITQLLVTSRR